eukprot:GFUD01135450.1.p1 GENE.GFUD01135450.1~~GFUD01135450.1.p1  ORF type:complete len:110 (+),score=26.00 GFUD01135450.1:3-332(+)
MAIISTGAALFCGKTAGEEDMKQHISALKVFEVLCEALPQVCLAWTYLSYTGWPWENEEAELWSYIPFLSSVSSLVMVAYGLYGSGMAIKNRGWGGPPPPLGGFGGFFL